MNSPRQGNLTGNPRKVRDTGADLHSISQLWQSYRDEGVGVIKDITEHKLRWLSEKEKRSELEKDLQRFCDSLEKILKKIERLVEKLETLTSQMEGMARLEAYQSQNRIGRFAPGEEPEGEIMFQTWPTKTFYETCDAIYQYHRSELESKTIICQNVAHSLTKGELIFYTAAWAHDPYIPDRCKLLLESFLCETGHR